MSGERHIRYQREYRRERKAVGMCTDCGDTPAVLGRTKCQVHLDKIKSWFVANRQYARDWQKQVRARRNARTLEDVLADQARLRPDGLKWCKKRADHDGPSLLAEFSNERANADGLRSLCKLCDNGGIRRIAEAHWRANNIPLECAYCPGPYEHVDHVVPRRRGGTDDPSNLMPSCLPCNYSKKATLVEEWLCLRATSALSLAP